MAPACDTDGPAAQNVTRASANASQKGVTGGWMVTQHVGKGWKDSARPCKLMPCLLHANSTNYWVGSWGRCATFGEHARAQGPLAAGVRWPKPTIAYALLGNNMAKSILTAPHT